MRTIKVLGIDASLSNFGLSKAIIDLDTLDVVIESIQLIQPSDLRADAKKKVRKNSDDLRRAGWLQSNLIKACLGFDVVVCEIPFYSQSARSAVCNGMVIGVLSSCPLPLIEVTPQEVKLSGHGLKTSTKAEMIDWCVTKHPNVNWKTRKLKGELVFTKDNEHCADATAAIYAAMETEQFKMLVSMMKRFSNPMKNAA